MGLWDACAEADAPDLAGLPCYAGLDLASSSDMASMALVFLPIAVGDPYRVRMRYWVPGENLPRRVEQTGVPYDVWARAGLLTATPGNVIDYQAIVTEICGVGALYQVREIAFDRWGAIEISQQLAEAGFTMVQFGQGFASMASPTKEWARLVALRGLAHDGNPILRWNVDNVQAEQDAAGNLKPSKRTSKGKIDGLVAGLMALSRAMLDEAAPGLLARGELAIL
jgi:phage terminase large subunit-like protein